MPKLPAPTDPPDQVVAQTWAALRTHGCLLCRQPATVCGVYVPGRPDQLSFSYLLCPACFALPDGERERRVDAYVAADMQRQAALN